MTDKVFLSAIAAVEVFLGWRLLSTPISERVIEFMPVSVFAFAFLLAGACVARFMAKPTRFWRSAAGGTTVVACAGRAMAILYAGYHDELIPLSRAQAGFAAWMLGALLATWVFAHLATPRGD